MHAYYPPPLASTSASSTDIAAMDADTKTSTDLLAATLPVQVIQLVEIAPPPRQTTRTLPPSSASAYSDSADSDDDDEEEEIGMEVEYCSSVDDEEGMEMERREEEESKARWIIAWRDEAPTTTTPAAATFVLTEPTPTSPTVPPHAMIPIPIPSTLRKRTASSVFTASASDESTPASKRSRTTASGSPSASPAPSVHLPLRLPSSTPTPYLAPPSPRARRYTSPRQPRPVLSLPTHQRSTSLVDTRGETHCSACDRRFASARAFRAHPESLDREADVEERAACGAAVAYAFEACAAALSVSVSGSLSPAP